MPNKIGRLTKDKEFDRVFRGGRSYYNQYFGFKIIKNELPINRLGIIISRKVSKKAVERNQLKRRIKEFLRLEADELKPGYDILLIVLPGAVGKKYQEIAVLLKRGLIKLKLFNN